MRLRRRVKRKSLYALVVFIHYKTICAVSNLVCGHTHLRPHSSSITLWLCAIQLVSASSLTFYVSVSVRLPFHLSFFLSFLLSPLYYFLLFFSFYFSLSQANSLFFLSFSHASGNLLIIIYILE